MLMRLVFALVSLLLAALPAAATVPYTPAGTVTISGCDSTGATDATACIQAFLDSNAGPNFYLGPGSYKISHSVLGDNCPGPTCGRGGNGSIYLVGKRLYGNNSLTSPTKLIAATGEHNAALVLQGASPGVYWIWVEANRSASRSSEPADSCITINGATGTSFNNPVLIANSTFRNCSGAGIFNSDYQTGPSWALVGGPSNWVVIAANWVYNSGADCIHNSTGGTTPIKNLVVEFNLVERCGDDGVAVGAYNAGTAATTNVVIQHNTIKNQNWAHGISEWVPCSPISSCVARNNYIFQESGYTSTVTSSQDSHACIMLLASPSFGGVGPVGWINHSNDCGNRGAYQRHANYMMWNGAAFLTFGNNSFVGNTSRDARGDCFSVSGSPHTAELITANQCAGTLGSQVRDASGTGNVTLAGNVSISSGSYRPINNMGGGPGSDPSFP